MVVRRIDSASFNEDSGIMCIQKSTINKNCNAFKNEDSPFLDAQNKIL